MSASERRPDDGVLSLEANMSGPVPEATPLAALHPAEWNPRDIRDERFQNLCRSIEADPEFLWRRPVLAQTDGTIYAGNMRFRAAQNGTRTSPDPIASLRSSSASGACFLRSASKRSSNSS